MDTAMTQIQNSAYGSSQAFVVQTNRLRAKPTPLATISQPSHRRKTPVLRTAQPLNAAKLPMVTQALANPMFPMSKAKWARPGSRSAPRLPAASQLVSVKR